MPITRSATALAFELAACARRRCMESRAADSESPQVAGPRWPAPDQSGTATNADESLTRHMADGNSGYERESVRHHPCRQKVLRCSRYAKLETQRHSGSLRVRKDPSHRTCRLPRSGHSAPALSCCPRACCPRRSPHLGLRGNGVLAAGAAGDASRGTPPLPGGSACPAAAPRISQVAAGPGSPVQRALLRALTS